MFIRELVSQHGFSIKIRSARDSRPITVKEKITGERFLCEYAPGNEFRLNDEVNDYELAPSTETPQSTG